MSTTTEQEPSPAPDLLAWLRGKLADAEQALQCREDMATAKPLSAEEWEELSKIPGVRVTKGRKMSKAAIKEMHEMPRRHKRIAEKCRHEVEMFRATIEALTQPNEKDLARRALDSE